MTEHEPFESTPQRSFEEVLAAYEAAEDLHEWLRGEVGVFLDNGDDPDQLEERIDTMLEILEERADQVDETVMNPGDLLGLLIEVFGDGPPQVMLLNDVLHPVELLWTVAHHASPGDVVQVTHHYVDKVVASARMWPFSVDDAVLLTSPDPRARAEAAIGEESDEDEPAFQMSFQAPVLATATFAAVCTVIGVAAGMFLTRRRR